MTNLRASLADVDAVWRAHGNPSALAARPEVRHEFCAYPKRILEEAIAELSADDLRASNGVERWLEVTRRVGNDWLTARLEIEAEWARKRATNPTPCPRCRRPLGAELCECGYRPGWVSAQPRTIGPGDVAQLDAPFATGWEEPPDLSVVQRRSGKGRRQRKKSTNGQRKVPRRR
jgi:hypothetical protein